MNREMDNLILSKVSLVVSPFVMLFALYVIFHGHYSPGGGFQGGTLLAAGMIIIRLVFGKKIAQKQFKSSWEFYLGAIGVLIYLGTGALSMFFGGNYLDYDFLPFKASTGMLHSIGILVVEVGVGLAVMGILLSIYDNLSGDEDNE